MGFCCLRESILKIILTCMNELNFGGEWEVDKNCIASGIINLLMTKVVVSLLITA